MATHSKYIGINYYNAYNTHGNTLVYYNGLYVGIYGNIWVNINM